VGPTLRAGVDYRCFQYCVGAQGDYPIAIALEGEAIYEIEHNHAKTAACVRLLMYYYVMVTAIFEVPERRSSALRQNYTPVRREIYHVMTR